MAAELVAAAVSALLGAMATDAWGWARSGFARLVGGEDRTRTEIVERRLDGSRAELAGRSGADLAQARTRIEAAWTARLADLIEEDPAAEQRLHALLADLAARAPQASAGPVQQQATAYDHARQAVQGHGTQTNTFGGGRDA